MPALVSPMPVLFQLAVTTSPILLAPPVPEPVEVMLILASVTVGAAAIALTSVMSKFWNKPKFREDSSTCLTSLIMPLTLLKLDRVCQLSLRPVCEKVSVDPLAYVSLIDRFPVVVPTMIDESSKV